MGRGMRARIRRSAASVEAIGSAVGADRRTVTGCGGRNRAVFLPRGRAVTSWESAHRARSGARGMMRHEICGVPRGDGDRTGPAPSPRRPACASPVARGRCWSTGPLFPRAARLGVGADRASTPPLWPRAPSPRDRLPVEAISTTGTFREIAPGQDPVPSLVRFSPSKSCGYSLHPPSLRRRGAARADRAGAPPARS